MNWKQKKRILNIAMMIVSITAVVIFALVSCGSGQHEKIEIVEAPEEVRLGYCGTEEYRVQSFDTLSAIAVKYIPSDEYMQQWIKDVIRLNDRKNDTIYFDETIKVYVYEKQ